MRGRARERVFALALVVSGTFAGLLLAELGLRYAWNARFSGYRALTPNLEAHFDVQSAPGVQGPSLFRVNSMGIRGREWSPDRSAEYRVLCMGGSTTESILTDQSRVWTALLEKRLGAVGGRAAWVGNIGRSGLASDEHVLQMRHLLDPYDPDAVVLLVGVNDLSRRLRRGDRDDPAMFEDAGARRHLEERAFAVSPSSAGRGWSRDNWLRRTRLWRLLRRFKQATVKNPDDQDFRGANLVEWRRMRALGRRRAELPELEPALERYRANLRQIVGLAREKHVSLLLVTQPTLWRAGLDDAARSLLWMGGVGDFRTVPGSVYFEPEALARGMDAYNRALLEVCRETGSACLDLAAVIPKTTEYFYDDCHFTDRAHERIADAVAEALVPPEAARPSGPSP